jgi:hypothetical protein
MKTLQDFKDIVANQNPNWTQKKINAEAKIRFNAQIAANNNSNTGGKVISLIQAPMLS